MNLQNFFKYEYEYYFLMELFPFSMAIENVNLMNDRFPKHSSMGTERMI